MSFRNHVIAAAQPAPKPKKKAEPALKKIAKAVKEAVTSDDKAKAKKED